MVGKVRGVAVQDREVFPIRWTMNNAFRVAARPFGVTLPPVFCAPVFQAKGRSRRDFHQVKVKLPLVGEGGGSQCFRILVVNRKMAPKRNWRPVKGRIIGNAGEEAFAMRKHRETNLKEDF